MCEGGFLIGYATTVNVQVGDDHKLGPFVPLAFTRQSSVTVRSEAKQRPHGSGELCRIRASEAGNGGRSEGKRTARRAERTVASRPGNTTTEEAAVEEFVS